MPDHDFSLVDVAIIDTQHNTLRVLREVLSRLGLKRVEAYSSARDAAEARRRPPPPPQNPRSPAARSAPHARGHRAHSVGRIGVNPTGESSMAVPVPSFASFVAAGAERAKIVIPVSFGLSICLLGTSPVKPIFGTG